MTTKKTTKTATKRKRTKSKLSDHEIERIREMIPTIDELRIIDIRRDYRAIRKARFGNSIPAVEHVLIALMPRIEMKRMSGEKDVEGACLSGFAGKLLTPYVIALADDLKVSDQRITLLHEMAHLKVNIKFGRSMGHGKQWKKEMRRLAAAGAFDDYW